MPPPCFPPLARRDDDYCAHQFDLILAQADLITKAHFDSRRDLKRRRVACRIGELDAEEAEGEEQDSPSKICDALVRTICAATNAPSPASLPTAIDAMRWASHAITSAREESILRTRSERHKHVLTPAQTAQAFDLVTRLTQILEQSSSSSGA